MAETAVAKRRRTKARVAKPVVVPSNGNGTGGATVTDTQQVAPAAAEPVPVVRRRRRKRNTTGLTGINEVGKAVLAALQKLRTEAGSDYFKAGIQTIVDNIEGTKPSRATAYRSVKKLAADGVFKLARDGERGHFTYDFGAGTPMSIGSSPPSSPVSRALVASVSNVLSEVEVSKQLDSRIEAGLARLRAINEAKRTQAEAIEAAAEAGVRIPA